MWLTLTRLRMCYDNDDNVLCFNNESLMSSGSQAKQSEWKMLGLGFKVHYWDEKC